MPKVIDVLPVAINTGDVRKVSACVDALRFKCDMTYEQVYALAKQLVPDLTPPQWENLMYAADMDD